MSVVGRLWRRAPAWRLCLVSAVACTGLAAMFPPALPHLPARRPSGGAAYRALAPAAAAPAGVTQLVTPARPPPLQGSIHFAGRLLPLPAGVWHEAAILKGGGADAPQTEILERIANGSSGTSRLTGIILAEAPGPLAGAAGPVELPLPCQDVGARAGELTPARPDQSPLAHECWVMTEVDTTHPGEKSLLRTELARLAERHVAVPPRMLGVDYVRTDETGWMTAIILLPAAHGTGPTRDWASRFARPMHRGFDNTLVPADLTPAAVDDPR